MVGCVSLWYCQYKTIIKCLSWVMSPFVIANIKLSLNTKVGLRFTEFLLKYNFPYKLNFWICDNIKQSLNSVKYYKSKILLCLYF